MNIVNRKIADECIHVVDAVSIGEEMALDFVKSLPDGFHNHLKNKVHGNNETGSGIRSRNINLATVFEYELCAVPPSTIDELNWYPSQREYSSAYDKNLPSCRPSPPTQIT